MTEKLKSLRKNHMFISLITSIFAVFLAWGIFISQYFLSDGVTLARNGDAAKQTFPCFVEMGELIAEYAVDGIDVFTVNGSNSIHMCGMEWYLPYRIFAYLGYMTSPLLMFMFFLALHMFINMYFSQRLCHVCFDMRPALAFLISICIASAAFWHVWFDSFFVINSLVIPLTYGLIYMLKKNHMISCALASFLYVAAFTSGYSVLSYMLALIIFVFSLGYGILYKINDVKRVISFSFFSAAIGAGISLVYMLSLFALNQNQNTKDLSSLYYATELSGDPSAIISKIFFYSVRTVFKEAGTVASLSLIWLFLIVAFIYLKIILKMNRNEKVIFWFGILTNLLILCVDLKNVLPFEKWFFMMPFLGGMHIRRRCFLIFVPFLFISFGIAIKKIKKDLAKKELLTILTAFVLLFAFFYNIAGDNINKESFLVEIILTGIAIYYGVTNGFSSRKFLLIFSCIVFCYGINGLYSIQEVTLPASSIAERSIAFNGEKQETLDNFVNQLSDKKIYKYLGLEGNGRDIPIFIPCNYGWYHRQNSLLSNYLKYPLHGGAVSDEYREAFTARWYDRFNIEYCYDTRADFVIISQEAIDNSPYHFALDETVQPVYLNDTMFCAKLKKYVPRHYTKGQGEVLDKNNSLDNGYFYCPTLNNENIVDFDTDNRTFFKLTVDADADAEIQYSMFACDNYTYYIDGEKYNPEKEYGLAYFKLPAGRHSIEIKYSDTVQVMIYWIFTIYYIVIALLLLAVGINAMWHYWKKEGQ